MRSRTEDVRTQNYKTHLDELINNLRSLEAGQANILDVLDLGDAAIPALRKLLFERQPSGIFDARCRAAELLSALKAFNVLAEFLRRPRPAADAVEALGEDVVVSAAGLAISRHREDWVYHLLCDLASLKPLNGILAGLGTFQREESISIFVSALAEDEVRVTAERVLRDFGAAARNELLAAASQPHQFADESESHLRKRRSALALLNELGIPERVGTV